MNATDLKSLRLRLHLTQSQMADKLGVSYATYSRYERGLCAIRKPVVILALKLSEALPAAN